MTAVEPSSLRPTYAPWFVAHYLAIPLLSPSDLAGFSLLYHLQTLVGVAPFDAFLHDYFQTFKYTSLTADDFKAYVIAYFKEGRWLLPRVGHTGIPPGHGGPLTSAADVAEIPALARLNAGGQPVPPVGGDLPADVIASAAASGIDLTSSVDWDAWFYGAGGPPVPITFAASERGAVAAHVAQWLADPDAAEAGGRTLTSAWPSSHWIAFVEGLNAASSGLMAGASKAIIHPAVLRRMDAAYGLGSMRNAEVRCGWLQTGVRSGLEGAVPAALAFLGEQGRMKVRACVGVGCYIARQANSVSSSRVAGGQERRTYDQLIIASTLKRLVVNRCLYLAFACFAVRAPPGARAGAVLLGPRGGAHLPGRARHRQLPPHLRQDGPERPGQGVRPAGS